jgi:hypothetical protein
MRYLQGTAAGRTPVNGMNTPPRRVTTDPDTHGESIILSAGTAPQHYPMSGPDVGLDFFEVWSKYRPAPALTAQEAREPNERAFPIMPAWGTGCASSISTRPRPMAGAP